MERTIFRGGKVTTEGRPAWRPSHPASKAVGKGSMFGTIGDVPLDTLSATRGNAPRPPKDGNKPLYTSPAKKGGYGFPEQARTIGSTVTDYLKDDFQPGRSLTTSMRKAHREKIPKAFVAGGKVGVTVGRVDYIERPVFDTEPGKKVDLGRGGKCVDAEGNRKIFVPSHPPVKGRGVYASINKTGLNYEYPGVPPRAMRKDEEEKNASWKPNDFYHSKNITETNPYKIITKEGPPPMNIWE